MTRKCDFVIVTDKEFSIDDELAESLNCKVFVDGTNAPPLSFKAEQYLLNKGVLIIPGVLSYSGEFICGYLEWLKNLEHRNLTILFKRFEKNLRNQFINMITQTKQKIDYAGPTEDLLVTSTITEMMDQAFDQMINVAETDQLSLREAGYSIGLNRIYNHYKEEGISL
jgi:glutamate dehydrogenase (NAD(P)+)